MPSSDIDADALLFVDSRYWILADHAIPKKGWKVVRVGATGGNGDAAVIGGWTEYLANELDGSRVGIDPKLITSDLANSILNRLAPSDTKLVPVKENLIDKVHSPPPRPLDPLTHYPFTLSGEKTTSKLKRIRNTLNKYTHSKEWIYLLPTITTIPWLLNYRCTDVPYTPVAFAYCVLTPDDCVLFVDKRKTQDDEEMLADFEGAGVSLKPYGVDEVQKFVEGAIKSMKEKTSSSRKVQIFASRNTSWALAHACEPVSSSQICSADNRLGSTRSHAPSTRPRCSRTPSSCRTSATPTFATAAPW